MIRLNIGRSISEFEADHDDNVYNIREIIDFLIAIQIEILSSISDYDMIFRKIIPIF